LEIEIMKNEKKTAKKDQPEKLVLSKEMVRNLNVRTSVQTGRRAGCPSWPDASCASGFCVML